MIRICYSACFVAVLFCTESTFGEVTEIAAKAFKILETHCYRCHGLNGSNEGGMNYIFDSDKLAARGFLNKEASSTSVLVKRIELGEMPADNLTHVSSSEIDSLKQWIAAGAPPLQEHEKRPELHRDHVTDVIVADLLKQPESNRNFLRYFSLTHYYHAEVPEDELQTYRNALCKMINSLTWRNEPLKLEAVDSQKTVFRIDLRQLGWSITQWNRIALRYDYALTPITKSQQLAERLTRSQIYCIRGDWFCATASVPPLYHELLAIPATTKELENRIGVDVVRHYADATVLRAGFNGSGVSNNNRLIERHDAPYGYYWKSFDFSGNTGAKNLFANPFGPGKGAKHFDHDGGELIFSLPNGFQAYMLVDKVGTRIDKGPTAIVSDPNRPDRAVQNGISCMGCHSQGLIRKVDQIRPYAKANPRVFDVKETKQIDATYVKSELFTQQLDNDTLRFRAALQAADIPFTKQEPILANVKKFESALDLKMLAGELELSPDNVREVLKTAGGEFGKSWGSVLLDGGTVQRENLTYFEFQLFADCTEDRRSCEGPMSGAYKLECMESPLRISLNESPVDTAMILHNPMPTVTPQKFKALADKGIGLIIETMPSVSGDALNEWVASDNKRKSQIVAKITKDRLNSTKNATVYLLIVDAPEVLFWHIEVKSGVHSESTRQKLLETVKPHFSKRDFDAGVAVLFDSLKTVSVLPSPSPKR